MLWFQKVMKGGCFSSWVQGTAEKQRWVDFCYVSWFAAILFDIHVNNQNAGYKFCLGSGDSALLYLHFHTGRCTWTQTHTDRHTGTAMVGREEENYIIMGITENKIMGLWYLLTVVSDSENLCLKWCLSSMLSCVDISLFLFTRFCNPLSVGYLVFCSCRV